LTENYWFFNKPTRNRVMMTPNSLSGSQIARIKADTEDIIENIGFRVMSAEARARARSAGALVHNATATVRIPPPLLRELLALAPLRYVIADGSGNEYTIGGDRQYCHGIVSDPWIFDYETQRAGSHPTIP
jgi:trimethylamine:corrinoid methyltransferase-like protein